MGEIAEYMLDGDDCQECGEPFMDGESPGHPRTCEGCSQALHGAEEGDRCGRDSCPGTIELAESENCSCHINPPCQSCVEAGLCCPECHWHSRYDDE